MKFLNQSELIKQMSDQQLKQQIYLSQLFLVILGIVLGFFLFDSMRDWGQLFRWSPEELFIYGVIPGLVVVLVDLILMRMLPAAFYDDGGINEKLFSNRTIGEIFIISMLVAGAEEFLFRGIIHTTFGYIPASLLFAFLHFRYLLKPVLLVSVLMVSFYLGWIYELTHNLLAVITAHFVIDFSLALAIKFKTVEEMAMKEEYDKHAESGSILNDKENYLSKEVENKEENTVDVLELPPRGSVHQNKKKRFSFISFFLFFMLSVIVILVIIYGLWGEGLINRINELVPSN